MKKFITMLAVIALFPVSNALALSKATGYSRPIEIKTTPTYLNENASTSPSSTMSTSSPKAKMLSAPETIRQMEQDRGQKIVEPAQKGSEAAPVPLRAMGQAHFVPTVNYQSVAKSMARYDSDVAPQLTRLSEADKIYFRIVVQFLLEEMKTAEAVN